MATAADQIVDVVTPAAGESVSEGTILEWHVKVGEPIKADDTIVEISTDKVDIELPSPASGVVTEILIEEGETVTVGQVIARISLDGAAPGAADGNGRTATTRVAEPAAEAPPSPATEPAPGAPPGPAEVPAAAAPATAHAPEPEPAASSPAVPGTARGANGAKISPVAARAAAVEGVDVSRISGSGPAGRVTKADVLEAASEETAAPAFDQTANGAAAVAAEATTTPMRGGAAALARYMEESRAVPTATSFRTIPVTVLEARRRELKEAGLRVSFTHLIAYAIALAASEMPVMTEHYAEIDGKPNRMSDGAVNLGLAVDVERKDGSRTLMVPVVRDAGRMPFDTFLASYDEVVEKARTNTLTADDLTGANISLTNPGGLGTIASVPRLMSGQGTIVATGSIAYPPGLAHVGESIGAEKVMTMTSTYDHRVIQGAESGRFLGLVESYLDGEHEFYETVFASLGVE